jgi:hypothetical protein
LLHRVLNEEEEEEILLLKMAVVEGSSSLGCLLSCNPYTRIRVQSGVNVLKQDKNRKIPADLIKAFNDRSLWLQILKYLKEIGLCRRL